MIFWFLFICESNTTPFLQIAQSLLARKKKERERETALGWEELFSSQLFKNKKECLIPCLHLHTDYADTLSFLFHLWEWPIHSQTVLHHTIILSNIALSSHIKTTCQLHFCWVTSQLFLAFLASCSFSSGLAGFEFMKEGPGRGGQSFIIHLEFFKPYYVTGPVLCSTDTGEQELGSALKDPIA